jgi:hypothetical protein
MAEKANGKTHKRKLLHPSAKVVKQSQPVMGADEYDTFATALKKVLTVSHSELQRRIKKVSSRVSNGKD